MKDLMNSQEDQPPMEPSFSATKQLFRELESDYGFTWNLMCHVLEVDMLTLIKWRARVRPMPEDKVAQLRELLVFAEAVNKAGIRCPSHWFSQKILPDYFITPKEIYIANKLAAEKLIKFVIEKPKSEQFLNEIVYNWRAATARDKKKLKLMSSDNKLIVVSKIAA